MWDFPIVFPSVGYASCDCTAEWINEPAGAFVTESFRVAPECVVVELDADFGAYGGFPFNGIGCAGHENVPSSGFADRHSVCSLSWLFLRRCSDNCDEAEKCREGV